MLSATEKCLLCPDCATNNIVYRATCWRCGADLPCLNAPWRSLHPQATPAPWSEEALNHLLSQAVLIDLTQSRRPTAKRSMSGAALRAAATLSFALFYVAAAPGSCESSGALSVSLTRNAISTTRTAPHQATKASPSLLARRQIANPRPIQSLDEAMRKIQTDLDARRRDFLTTGLNMVRDYEAIHGPVVPAADALRLDANAPYSDYIAHMKFTLMQEGLS